MKGVDGRSVKAGSSLLAEDRGVEPQGGEIARPDGPVQVKAAEDLLQLRLAAKTDQQAARLAAGIGHVRCRPVVEAVAIPKRVVRSGPQLVFHGRTGGAWPGVAADPVAVEDCFL